MEENWGSILVGVLPNDTKKNNTKRTHLSPGVKTPNEAYRIPILKSLIKLGGSAKARDVLEIVEIEMRDRLKAVDYELLSSGRARWKSSASWERSTMKDEGLINPESPHGTWEITDKGRSFLEKNVQ
jgi:hypothetical protein